MKVAIVHDELMRRGGAEQVVLTMLKAFPNADVFTLAYDPNGTYPEFKQFHITASWFQRLAVNVKTMHTLYFPFAIWAMKSLKVNNYDVVIISNTHCAKYVNIDPASKVFIYTYTPFRLAWNPESYTQYINAHGIKRWVFDYVIKYLKKVDAREAQKGDYYLGMTEETSERIRKAYKVSDVMIIRPDVKCRFFSISDKPKEYFLLVSRLEYYKKADLAIKAFNKLGYKLIIVGNGTKAEELKAMSNDNIEFKKGLSNEELADLYANCKALIFPQHEDYGITPLEANASGRPVIAYGVGGIKATMIPYKDDSLKSTAIFFNEQTVKSLCRAIEKFEQLEFDPLFIKNHAEKFDEEVFISEIKEFVNKKYKETPDKKVVTEAF
ncbi:glycosyltransferase [Mucilaginibacter sp.]|uniref:glycosyltransferase n=1 Tax=Mucilaginibacter sp. TaxID=1882438 RepID=UPI00260DD5BD|nr:glycosyltransferase [Mucilaginibacter sp.]MDB4926290.1 glycosyl transferase group 1 [Mucilaginibacter sp.]